MGAILASGHYVECLAVFLPSTQSRVALSVAKLDDSTANKKIAKAVYKAYTLIYSSPVIRKSLRQRVEVALADLTGKNSWKSFWASQMQVCEQCRSRPPCTRAPCDRCSGRRHQLCVAGVADWCCVCASDFEPRQRFTRRINAMVQAQNAWNKAACNVKAGSSSYLNAQSVKIVSLASVAECGGLALSRPKFDNIENMFWQCVRTARRKRMNLLSCLDVVEGHFGAEAANACLEEGVLEMQDTGSSLEARHFVRYCVWEVMTYVRDIWEKSEKSTEEVFFEAEVHALQTASNAAALLRQVSTLHKGHARIGEALREVGGLMPSRLRRLSVLGILLLGESTIPVPTVTESEQESNGPGMRALGRRILKYWGLPALHIGACNAEDFREKCFKASASDKAARFCLEHFDSMMPTHSRYSGLSFGAVWSNDAAYMDSFPLNFSSCGEDMRCYAACARKVDPDSAKVAASLMAHFADKGGEEDTLEAKKTETKVLDKKERKRVWKEGRRRTAEVGRQVAEGRGAAEGVRGARARKKRRWAEAGAGGSFAAQGLPP